MMKVAWVRGEREYSAHRTLDKALTGCQLSSSSVVSLMRFFKLILDLETVIGCWVDMGGTMGLFVLFYIFRKIDFCVSGFA